jgi:hypothetical protein
VGGIKGFWDEGVDILMQEYVWQLNNEFTNYACSMISFANTFYENCDFVPVAQNVACGLL